MRRTTTRASWPAALAAAACLAAAPGAWADETVYAGPIDQYLNPTLTIDVGEQLTFKNLDVDTHDVVAVDKAGGKPLFGTPRIGTGSDAIVQGVQQLKGGRYEFFCTLHPYMKGTLFVSGGGTPSPPPSGDTTAPKVTLSIVSSSVSRVRKDKKLQVKVTVDEPGNVQLTATTKDGKKTVTLARATKGFTRSGSATVSMPLTSSGRSALNGRSSAVVSLSGRATDGAGNAGSGTAKRTLKR